jgi:hypothetical protein
MYGYRTEANINSFEDIERRYNNIKPIREKDRGIQRDIRPMGERTNKTRAFVKLNNDQYACRLYRTDCVIYNRNGTIEVRCGGYPTVSTAEFIGACLPSNYYAHMERNAIHIKNRYYSSVYRLDSQQAIVISPTGSVTGSVPNTKSLVDKPLTKIAREKHKPFLAFAKSFMETLNIEVPRPAQDSSLWYNDFFEHPEKYTEDNYIDILGTLVYERWRSSTEQKSYANIAAKVRKVGTVYYEVNLPIGE